jgi:NuA3 HAT complex component NTO1
MGEEQDSKCAICDDGDCENTNAIVFCDGCDLAVHQECYGVPFIPEGQWLCRKCQLIGQNAPDCIFCPNIEGAFKQTSTLRWAHLLCAIWIPEVSIGNQTFMEPVMDVEKVPRPRWKLVGTRPVRWPKLTLHSIATSASNDGVPASSAAIRIASLPFT